MMETKNVILVLLVIAILFSAVSIILNLSLNYGFKSVESSQQEQSSTGDIQEGISGNQGGNINLVVEPEEEEDG